MHYYFTNGAPFVGMATHGNEYDTFEPKIRLFLSQNTRNSQEYVASLKNQFPELYPSVVRLDHPGGEAPAYCLQFEGNVLRDVFNALYQNEFISASVRAEASGAIEAFEKSMERRLYISDVMSHAQKETMEMIVSPYIDSIFDEIPDLTLALNVCAIGMRDFPVSNVVCPVLISFFMRVNGIEDQFNASISDPEKKNEVFDCIGQLLRIYSQAEKLEDTWLRLGGNLPNEKLQRNEIARIVLAKANKKLNEGSGIYSEVHSSAQNLINKQSLDANLISEIQDPNTSKENAATHEIQKTDTTEYVGQNAMLYQLHLLRQERQANRDKVKDDGQLPPKRNGFDN